MDNLSTEIKVKEIINSNNGELIILSDFNETEDQIKSKVALYSDLVITESNLAEGKLARKDIRDVRYSLQNVQKHNFSVLNKAKEKIKSDTDMLIGHIAPVEERMNNQIKEIENAKKQRKELEEKRKVEIKAKLSLYQALIESSFETLTEDNLKAILSLEKEIKEKIKNEFFQEYEFDGKELLETINRKLPEYQLELNDIIVKKIEIEKQKKVDSRIVILSTLGLEENNNVWSYKSCKISISQITNFTENIFNKFLKRISDFQKNERIEAELIQRENEKKALEYKNYQDEIKKQKKESIEKDNLIEELLKEHASLGLSYPDSITNKDVLIYTLKNNIDYWNSKKPKKKGIHTDGTESKTNSVVNTETKKENNLETKTDLVEALSYYYEVDIDNCKMKNEDWINELAEALTDKKYLSKFKQKLEDYSENR